MKSFASVAIRPVEPGDLAVFFAQQLNPEAIRMAAFVAKDPWDQAAFHAHWDKILRATLITQRTILAEGKIAGYVGCFPLEGTLEVTYWVGHEFWGRGVATQALEQMLHLVVARPIRARVAADNVGSLRVLEKCGFKITGNDRGFANGRGEETEEYLLRLDIGPPPANLDSTSPR